MVEPRKTHKGYTTHLYLAIFLTHIIGLIGCSDRAHYEIVDLHFKNASQVKPVLLFLLNDTPEIQFSNKTILIPSNSKNTDIILKIIKEIDKPPTAYQLQFNKKNIKSRSTSNKKDTIHLIEGKETVTQYNNQNLKITIFKASMDSSLIDIRSLSLANPKNSYQKNNWLIKHNQRNEIAQDIFPNGFILRAIE